MQFKDLINFFSPVSKCWNGIPTTSIENLKFSILIAQGLYAIHEDAEEETASVRKISLSDIVNQPSGSVKVHPVCQLTVEGMKVKGVTNIGSKLIVFLARSGMESFAVECYDLVRCKSTVMQDQLGSTEDLISFRRADEAFVLQTNGAFWRLRFCSATDQLTFTQELQLWDGP